MGVGFVGHGGMCITGNRNGDVYTYSPKILQDGGTDDPNVEQPAELHLDMGRLGCFEVGAGARLKLETTKYDFGAVELRAIGGYQVTQASLRDEEIKATWEEATDWLQSESELRVGAEALYSTHCYGGVCGLVGGQAYVGWANMSASDGSWLNHDKEAEFYLGYHYNPSTDSQRLRRIVGVLGEAGGRVHLWRKKSPHPAVSVLFRAGQDVSREEIGPGQFTTFEGGAGDFTDLSGNSSYWDVMLRLEYVQ